MFSTIWAAGLIRRRSTRLAAAMTGVAVAVALLARLGIFLVGAQAEMTSQAAARVPLDWQVQVQPDASIQAVIDALNATPTVRAALPVGYAHSSGFSATTGGTTQTTGPAMALGLPPGYTARFPAVLRPLIGADHGVLIAQQTAANLNIGVGDTVFIGRAGLLPVLVVVDGVVDVLAGNDLFQNIGAAASAQPSAPPDNVVLLDETRWHTLFDPLAAARPDLVSTQIHTALDHSLPADPGRAFTTVAAEARNVEARAGGGARIGDNLAATLDAARSDAAYARILFLFLGAPAVAVAALLTATVVAVGADRRRRDQALLRARGATTSRIVCAAAAEALLVGVIGGAVGLGAASPIGPAALGTGGFDIGDDGAWPWVAAAAGTGLAITAATMLAPAWRDARRMSVRSARAALAGKTAPAWTRYGIDMLALATAAVLWWLMGGGYQLVLAPEGVSTIAVSYWAFAAPTLVWIGAALLTWRLADAALGRGSAAVATALRPVAGKLAPTVAHSIARQRGPLARAIVLVALALAFAASTATFNATYRAQANVDALLTNGADVTVTEPPSAAVGPELAGQLAAIRAVRAVEPIQHRFAYVGPDLQDLYGVNPATIIAVTALQDNYFPDSSAAAAMHALAAAPDSVLVSAETVKDFQLHMGDPVNLRLQDTTTHQNRTVAFRFAGVVAEFPTAPRDSFLVANAAYISRQTGSNAMGAFLIDTGGRDTAAVAARVRAHLGVGATVTDIDTTRAGVGSSLTAVDLSGLSRIELGFGVALAAAAGALAFGLNLAERRRNLAVITALGARPRQLRSFVLSETAVLLAAGLFLGAAVSSLISWMLIRTLSGVFDPPPQSATVPWPYLGAVAAAIVIATLGAAAISARLARRDPLAVIREL